MALKQTRRTISVSREHFDRLKSFCAKRGIPMSQFTESALTDKMLADGYPPLFRLRPHHEKCTRKSEEHALCPIS